MRVYLIGYMASGKSWLGKELAAAMEYDFIDLDELFETRYRVSILDFFAKYGENLFRSLEENLLRETGSMDRMIISTGGGAPGHFDNMAFILKSGTSIYLRMTLPDLLERISGMKKKRPLLKDIPSSEMESFISRQLAEREPFYLQANHIFDGPDYPIQEIVNVLRES